MLKEFKQFILRGNVIDLAVGIMIGASFGAVITAFVKDIITPLIGLIGGKPNFTFLIIQIHGSKFFIGDFLNTILSFIIISGVIFFFVVKPVNTLIEKTRKPSQSDETTQKCPECLSTITKGAKRCSFCTSYIKS